LADDFHPYREWLGLTSRTPDYYELLALPASTADPQQIAAAAERATTKVRSFRPGPHARAWSQLLDEIQAARECLCDPARRAEYDAHRRAAVASPQSAAHHSSESAPPSVLAPISNELYPPGMARPATATAAAAPSPAPKPSIDERAKSDLDPPTRQPTAASEEGSTPHSIEMTSDELLPPTADMPDPAPGLPAAMQLSRPLPESLPAAAMPMAIPLGQAAGMYPSAVPLGMPTEMPGALPDTMQPYGSPQLRAVGDPMSPVPIEGLLPPGAAAHESLASTSAAVAESNDMASASADLRMHTAPSAARFGQQRARQAQRGLALMIAGCVALIAVAAGAYWFGMRHSQLGPAAVAETPSPEPKAEPRSVVPEPNITPRPEAKVPTPQPDVVPMPVVPTPVVPAPVPTPVTTSDPMATTPAPVTPSPTPTPVPTPQPTPEPAPPSPTVTKAEVQALIKSLDAAKTALGEQNFKAADGHLTRAQSLAKLPKHQEAVARLKTVGEHVKQFRQALADAVQGMQAGETFKVGSSTQVSFIEGFPDKVVLRIAGMNRTYPFNDMPPGLAVALADFRLPSSAASSRVTKGAYLLVHKRADDKEEEKAKALWEEAQASGADLSKLMPFLKDNYADFLKDARGM
jgi:curved DNA-binding protein CbpA